MQPGPYDVRLQLALMLCWRCGQLVKAVRGYLTHRALYHSPKSLIHVH